MNKILKWVLITVGIFVVIIITLGFYLHLFPRIIFVEKMNKDTFTGELALPWTIGEGEGFSGENTLVGKYACKPGLKPVDNAIYSGGKFGCAIPMCDCEICTKCGDGICGKGENHCNCPKDCKEGEGIFVESNDPKITSIGTIGNALVIGGRIKGGWFFEGQLPVKLLDAKGNPVSEGMAVAKSEWMTEDWVSFEVSFPNTDMQKGSLLLSKDNPSGLPQNNNSISVPFSF